MSPKKIKTMIAQYSQHLQELKDMQALRGLDTPPAVLTEIEDIEAKIEELQTELKELAQEQQHTEKEGIISSPTERGDDNKGPNNTPTSQLTETKSSLTIKKPNELNKITR